MCSVSDGPVESLSPEHPDVAWRVNRTNRLTKRIGQALRSHSNSGGSHAAFPKRHIKELLEMITDVLAEIAPRTQADEPQEIWITEVTNCIHFGTLRWILSSYPIKSLPI